MVYTRLIIIAATIGLSIAASNTAQARTGGQGGGAGDGDYSRIAAPPKPVVKRFGGSSNYLRRTSDPCQCKISGYSGKSVCKQRHWVNQAWNYRVCTPGQ